MVAESEVLARVAKIPVETDQRWIASFVTPCKLSVLQLDLLEVASVEGLSELTHEAKIQVGVVLVRGLIYEVEIPNNEPLLIVSGSTCDSLIEKSSLFGVDGRAVDVGEFEGGATCTDADVGRDEVSPNVNVCNGYVIIIPKEKDSPSGASCRPMSEGAKPETPNISSHCVVDEVELVFPLIRVQFHVFRGKFE